LAYQLGLEKLEYIDNFQDEALLLKHFPEFVDDYMANLEQLQNIGELPVYQKTDSIGNKGVLENDLVELYLFLNSKDYQTQDYEAQWEIWQKTHFPSKTDRSRYALWEMRNLQIAANIMQVAAHYPGQRILVIIGASHKLFLEKYLKQVPTLKLLKFE
jgi:hypothetical protein